MFLRLRVRFSVATANSLERGEMSRECLLLGTEQDRQLFYLKLKSEGACESVS